jgi:hypothetical protein
MSENGQTAPREAGSHRAFVAGSTSPTGRAVVDTLLELGIETIAHVRPDQLDLDGWMEWFQQRGAEVDLTAWEQQPVSDTLDRLKPTLVFSLLGSSPERIRGENGVEANPFVDSYKAVDLGLTAMLVRAAASAGSNPHVVLASATRAREGGNEFEASKAKAEEFVRKSGLPHTIVRIERVLDTEVSPRPHSSFFRSITEILLERKRRRLSMTTAELAEVMVACALDPAFHNRTLEPEEYV